MAARQRLQLTWFNKDQALIPTEHGEYGYTWVDPSDPRYCETRPLVLDEYVCGEQSLKSEEVAYSQRADLEPTTDNLLIHGESGDVLEALTRAPNLAEKYLRQVKLIYIDPPFNTAQTFADYEDNLEHSVWLTMMRDRLLHMQRLLRDDGSIWVHLDDVEVHRMRCLMDEIFGAENFISLISWEKVAGRDNRSIMSKTCDFILVYARKKERFKATRNLLPRNLVDTETSYTNPDNDPRGPWTSGDFTVQYNPAENERLDQIYELKTPSGKVFDPPSGRVWLMKKNRYFEMLADGRLWFGEKGTNIPRLKRFLSEVQDGLVAKTLWPHVEVGHNDAAKKEIQRLFPGVSPFSTPKPERLLERLIHIGSNPGDIVLDVFAGSGTTAAVAHKMGRRWVACELLEETFTRFTKTRLTKVVHDQDPGGVTRSADGRVAADDITLPEGMTVEEAQKFTSLLNKLISDDPELKKSAQVKHLKSITRTQKSPGVINWRGGGGFQVAHLAPACFDYNAHLGRVMLTEAATGRTLVESVAVNLGFNLDLDDIHFDGKLGRTLLKVHEGILDVCLADEWLSYLDESEKLVIAATGVVDGVREHLRRKGKGSRVVHIPDDIFRYNGEAN